MARGLIPGQYDAKALSERTSEPGGGGSIVQQSFAEEADINTIVRRFGISQSAPLGTAAGVYGDFTGITDYQSALEAIERVQAGFLKLDPEVRERFGNDPGRLYRFAQELPLEEFEELLEAPAPPEAAAVPVTPAD